MDKQYILAVIVGFVSALLYPYIVPTNIINNLTVNYSPNQVLETLTEYLYLLKFFPREVQVHIDSKMLASSVWCTKRLNNNKLCFFQNVYYVPHFKKNLIFLLNEQSVVSGIESIQDLKTIPLSTVTNHTGFDLKLLVIKSNEYIIKQNVSFLDGNTLIMKRFKPDNIMHVIHDDLFPIFLTFQELCKGDVLVCAMTYQLLFLDDSDEGLYFEWYSYFSHYKPLFLTKMANAVCIKSSVIGLSSEGVWFQYGYKNVQGPVPNTRFNGILLQKFSSYLKEKFGIGLNERVYSNLTMPESIVFLSRKINRKILNEIEVEKCVEVEYNKIFNKPVQILNMDLSINTSKTLIAALHKSKFLIGMHGSAMIFGIFLPPGSHIIELFPFGIQPEFVSPVKALCTLPNIFYNYKAWVNNNENNTVIHPEYPLLEGGLYHLPEEQRQIIKEIKLVPPVKCCHDPVYLFRMFQDTIVDESFHHLVHNELKYRTATISDQALVKKVRTHMIERWYFPPPIFNLTCECSDQRLKLLWNYPYILSDNVKFSLATSLGFNIETEFTQIEIATVKCSGGHKLNSHISIWVKTLEGSKQSVDTFLQCNYSS